MLRALPRSNQLERTAWRCLATLNMEFEDMNSTASIRTPGKLVALSTGWPALTASRTNWSQDLYTPKKAVGRSMSSHGLSASSPGRIVGKLHMACAPVSSTVGSVLVSNLLLQAVGRLCRASVAASSFVDFVDFMVVPPLNRNGGFLSRRDPAGTPRQAAVNCWPGETGRSDGLIAREITCENSDKSGGTLLAFGWTPTIARRYW